jgi:hypothetical protein
MKARDLAALAALGIAGKMAYDKFGRKKDDEPKTKGELGKSKSANDSDAGESEARMDNYSNEGRNAKFANEDYSNEGRGKAAPDYSNEGRGKVKKEIEYPLFPRPVAKKEAVVKRDKEDFSNEGRNSKRPTVVTRPTGDDRFVTPEEGAKAYKPRYNPAADSNAASATFSSTEEGMKANVPRRPVPTPTFSSTEEGMQNYVPRRTVPDYSNEGRGSRAPVNATFSSTEEGMQNYVPRRIPGAADAANPTFSSSEESMANYVPRRTPPAATFSNTEEGMQNYVPRRPGQAPVASSTAAGMAAYVPRNLAAVEQARLDALRSSGGRRAKGGVVKMASGGITSSKMSKPSGASRGDGIAQRGRTRGTLR